MKYVKNAKPQNNLKNINAASSCNSGITHRLICVKVKPLIVCLCILNTLCSTLLVYSTFNSTLSKTLSHLPK